MLTTQYNTRPAGKKKNITENATGMIFIIFACIGSAGGGLRKVCANMVIAISAGRM
ncbi:hypothetical protein D3C72_1743730 [compost metagenome]